MNGKVARRQRALRRSQENTRLTRKAASVDRSAHEQEFDRLLAELRKDRAEALKTANAEYEKTVKKAAKVRTAAVQAADESYIEKRDAIVKRLAAEQAQAA